MIRSDHNIILFEIELDMVTQPPMTRRYDTRNVNWHSFREKYIAEIRDKNILNKINNCSESKDIEDITTELAQAVESVCETTLSKVCKKRSRVEWQSSELDKLKLHLVRIKRSIRRARQQNREGLIEIYQSLKEKADAEWNRVRLMS